MKNIKHDKLLEAVQYGETKTVRKALKRGRNPNKRTDKSGYSFLHWAAQEYHEKMVRLLVKYGADIEAHSYGTTPLINASGNGSIEMVRLLVELGADVNAEKGSGTPLINAAAWGNEATVRFLIESGANVNGRDKRSKQTPLFSAARQGHLEMIKLLLEAGADKNLRDKKNRRAADIARKSGEKAIARRNKSIALHEAIAERLA